MEGDDDRRLDLGLQERLEAERRHAVDERRAVLGIAREARRLAALLVELDDGLAQRGHDVRRRREAPLAGALHVGVLVVQVHRQRLRVACAALQRALPDEHEAHAGWALEALAARRDERVEADAPRIDGQRPVCAHRVDDQALAVARAHVGDVGERIEDAGARLAMDEPDVRDARVCLQLRVEAFGRHRFVFATLDDRRAAPRGLAAGVPLNVEVS